MSLTPPDDLLVENPLQLRINELEAENAALVEAIQTHKDSFMGKEEDIVPEDEALWKALLPKEKAS